MRQNRSIQCGVALGYCTLSEDPNLVLWDAQDTFIPTWDNVIVSRMVKNPTK